MWIPRAKVGGGLASFSHQRNQLLYSSRWWSLYKRTCGSNPLAFSESQSFPGKDGFSSCFLSSKHFLQQTLLYFFQQAAQVVVPLLLSYRYHLLGTHFPLIYIRKFDLLFWMNGHIIIQVIVWQNYIWIDLLHVKLLFSVFPFISSVSFLHTSFWLMGVHHVMNWKCWDSLNMRQYEIWVIEIYG